MRILLVEDDRTTRRLIEAMLEKWGFRTESSATGPSGLDRLTGNDPPPMALLDWMMPGLEGPQLCREIRSADLPRQPYLIMLTARSRKEDLACALDAGADDFLSKPFHTTELRARIDAGRRILTLQDRLAARVSELEEALEQIHVLKGILPICSYCKKIRDDTGYWNRLEEYIKSRSQAEFSHGICPECLKAHFPEIQLL